MRFCLCIFESDTVKSDCPFQIFRKNDEIFKDYLTSFTVFLEILKKKNSEKIKNKIKKSSENDQSTGHFQSFSIYFFFVPPTLNLKKNPVNQLIKKILALCLIALDKAWLAEEASNFSFLCLPVLKRHHDRTPAVFRHARKEYLDSLENYEVLPKRISLKGIGSSLYMLQNININTRRNHTGQNQVKHYIHALGNHN